MRSVCVLAPAKVNLTLDIVGKRPNGYHDLESVMQTVGLYDELTVTKVSSGVLLDCSSNLPQGRNNIVVRAAEAFLSAAEISGGTNIRLHKRIPMGAGMGGGSADAAAVLTALDRLYETGWTKKQLMALGESLGADVPFCLYGGTAFVEGIGEKITPLCPLPSASFVIVKPKFSISTQDAYAAADRGEIAFHPDHAGIRKAIAEGNLPGIAKRLCNVFEQVTPNQEIHAIRQALLQQGALGAVMTGSGSAVFGIFWPDPEKTAQAASALRLQFSQTQVFVADVCSQGSGILPA